MKKKTLALDKIVPYEKNPRKISKDAVAAVKKSIEQFGYNVPIIVDEKNCILTGHTRLLALKELKWEKAVVLVAEDLTPEQAREFRILDNRISEMSKWDHDLLKDELRAVAAAGEMDAWFDKDELENIMGSLDEAGQSAIAPSQEEIEKKEQANKDHYKGRDEEAHSRMVEVECGHCNEKFFVDSRLAD